MKIQGADGKQWIVGRRWLPWRPKTRVPEGGSDLADMLSIGEAAEIPVIGIVFAVIAGVILLVLVLFFLLPLLLMVAEVLVLLLIAMAAVAGRVILRRPWTVEARRDGQSHAIRVSGWRASGRARAALAEAVRTGRLDEELGLWSDRELVRR